MSSMKCHIPKCTCPMSNVNFKTIFFLKIHIGKVHKEDVLESTLEKERDKVQDESSLLLTPIKEVREEPEVEDKNTCQLGSRFECYTFKSYPNMLR